MLTWDLVSSPPNLFVPHSTPGSMLLAPIISSIPNILCPKLTLLLWTHPWWIKPMGSEKSSVSGSQPPFWPASLSSLIGQPVHAPLQIARPQPHPNLAGFMVWIAKCKYSVDVMVHSFIHHRKLSFFIHFKHNNTELERTQQKIPCYPAVHCVCIWVNCDIQNFI